MAGLLLMVFTFTTSLVLGVVGIVVMLGCALALEQNVRKLGRAGLESLTVSMHKVALSNMLEKGGGRGRRGPDEPPN